MDYKSIYAALCDEQLEAADPDYADFFEQEFCAWKDDPNWSNPNWAKARLTSLLSELYEDCIDFYGLCEQCGLDHNALTMLGF